MKYSRTLLITFALIALLSCSQKNESPTLPYSSLVELLTPTLASAIEGAAAAVQTAKDKPDYAENTLSTLVALDEQLVLLRQATALILEHSATHLSVEQLETSAEKIHQLRGLIEADIITLKATNTAAAIRLGVVNELAEFCELTAEDIAHGLNPIAFE